MAICVIYRFSFAACSVSLSSTGTEQLFVLFILQHFFFINMSTALVLNVLLGTISYLKSYPLYLI